MKKRDMSFVYSDNQGRPVFLGTPNRIEEVVFKLKFDGSNLTFEDREEVTKRIKNWVDLSNFAKNEDINLTSKLEFSYFGKAVGLLETILFLWDKTTVIEVNTEEIGKGKILIQEVLCKLEQIEKKYQNGKIK